MANVGLSLCSFLSYFPRQDYNRQAWPEAYAASLTDPAVKRLGGEEVMCCVGGALLLTVDVLSPPPPPSSD